MAFRAYMLYNNTLRILVISCVFLSFSITSSYSLTESVDLFGKTSSVDLVLNDIWIEPENPKKGEALSIHGSLYNAGIIQLEEVSDAVTVGYIVNDEIVEINLLENILPGIENGVEISSGPTFDAVSGNYVVTVIVNYHDTLSHLRDNPENNIVQKRFQIGVSEPSSITYDIHQHYDDKTNKQQIKIQGELMNIFQEKLENKEIVVDIKDVLKEKILTNTKGEFSFETKIPFKNELIEITAEIEEKSFVPSPAQTIFPIKLNNEQSALALEMIPNISDSNFENQLLEIIIFQDSYDKLFKKISTEKDNKQDVNINNFILSTLPTNHEYIIEVYMGGRILDAFQNYFPKNVVIKEEISILESAEIQFRVTNKIGEPQNDVLIENWIYSSTSNENGFTDWIDVLPTFIESEPYVAKAIFPNGEIVWSEPFEIKENERKTIHIVKGDV